MPISPSICFSCLVPPHEKDLRDLCDQHVAVRESQLSPLFRPKPRAVGIAGGQGATRVWPLSGAWRIGVTTQPMDNQDALRQATLIFQGLGCPLPWFWEGADNVCGRRRSNEDPLIFGGCKHASGPDWDCSEEKTGEKNFPKMTQKWLLRGHGAEKPLPLSTVTARVDGGLPQFYIVKSFIHKLRGQSLECFFGSIEVLRWTSGMVPFDFTHGVPGMRGVCSAPHDARREVPCCWGANPEQLMILGTATRYIQNYQTWWF